MGIPLRCTPISSLTEEFTVTQAMKAMIYLDFSDFKVAAVGIHIQNARKWQPQEVVRE